MTESLRRQRRNLIITSLIIVFILYSEVEISKINILGIEIVTPNQNALTNILWIIWAYFLIRFYQYLKVEPTEGFVDNFKKKFHDSSYQIVMSHVNPNKKYPKFTIGDYSIWRLRRASFFKWVLPITEYDPERGEKVEIGSEVVPTFVLLRQSLKAIGHTIAHTPKFSDNVLPFLLALGAVAYGILKYLK